MSCLVFSKLSVLIILFRWCAGGGLVLALLVDVREDIPLLPVVVLREWAPWMSLAALVVQRVGLVALIGFSGVDLLGY